MKRSTQGTLTMLRSGSFKVKTYGNDHCGLKQDLFIRYSVTVVCEATVDARGFLFDQVNVDKFFQTIKATKLSCEQFAIDCSRKLWKQIKLENPDCTVRHLDVTISPEPHSASMTFTFDQERDSKPTTKVRKE